MPNLLELLKKAILKRWKLLVRIENKTHFTTGESMNLQTQNKNQENSENRGDTGLELSGLQWLLDHHQAKEKYRRQMVEDLNLKPGNIVLDLACGPGLWSDYFAEKVAPNGKVVGIDLSAELIDYAQSNLDKSTYKEVIEYKQASFLNVPYEDEYFDIIFAGNCLSYLTPPMREKLLNEQKKACQKRRSNCF